MADLTITLKTTDDQDALLESFLETLNVDREVPYEDITAYLTFVLGSAVENYALGEINRQAQALARAYREATPEERSNISKAVPPVKLGG